MQTMVDIAALNSHIKFDKTDIPFSERELLGDATETGLARFCGKTLEDYDGHNKKYLKVFEVPFNSTNKWALVIASLPTLKRAHNFGSDTFVNRLTKSTTTVC